MAIYGLNKKIILYLKRPTSPQKCFNITINLIHIARPTPLLLIHLKFNINIINYFCIHQRGPLLPPSPSHLFSFVDPPSSIIPFF